MQNEQTISSGGSKSLLEYLIPIILKTQFHKTLLDTNASEHGARMTAMDKTTENADSLLKELKINYNKARQEAITNELSENSWRCSSIEWLIEFVLDGIEIMPVQKV